MIPRPRRSPSARRCHMAGDEHVSITAGLVVFGASGDLAHRKLYPALASLAARGQLPARFQLIGVARTEMDDAGFEAMIREAVEAAGGQRGESGVELAVGQVARRPEDDEAGGDRDVLITGHVTPPS